MFSFQKIYNLRKNGRNHVAKITWLEILKKEKNIYISKTEHEHSCLHLSPYVFVGHGLHICPVFDVYPFGQAAKEKEMISSGSNVLSIFPFEHRYITD